MLEVKGSVIKDNYLIVVQQFGEEGAKRWIAAMPPESQKIYNNPIMSTSWYPYVDASYHPLKTLFNDFYQGDARKMHEFGRQSADMELNGIYKVFIKISSVSFLLKTANKLTETIYRGSFKLELFDQGPNHWRVQQSGLPDDTPIPENIYCGWMERAMEICGAKDIKVTITRSQSTGAPCNEFDITWK